ncbi:SMI1/KNR4 family protein [Niallia taxi]|uniref:SMI1/KNR4 family protein n=1 Tax=Niallia taxi TaxID=2499688 RepID=UPI00316D2C15
MNEIINAFFLNYPEEYTIGKGIKEETVLSLENMLNVTLPKSYRQYLVKYGFVEMLGRSIFGYEPPDETTVVRYTERLLKNGLPKGFMVVEDVHEFIYCLNTNEMNGKSECPVVCYFPYGNTVCTDEYSSIEEYLIDIIEEGIDKKMRIKG